VALAVSHFKQMAATDIPQRNDKGLVVNKLHGLNWLRMGPT